MIVAPFRSVPGDKDDETHGTVRVFQREYRGISLIRKRAPLGPNRRPMARVLGWS